MNCEYCEELKENKNLVFETNNWKVFLSKDQAYLGRCRIISKKHISELLKLNKEEWEDFHNIIKRLEKSLKKAFDAKMFNWTCMMNDAYLEKNPNPHIHWHFRPRYDKKIKILNVIFQDKEFGKHYDRARKQEISEKIMNEIIKKLK